MIFRKNGFFVKIYLWFLATSAAILVTQLGLDWLTMDRYIPRHFHLEQSLKPALSLHTHTVLQKFRKGDLHGITEARDELRNTTGLNAYTVNKHGLEISGQALPESIRQAAAKAMTHGRFTVEMSEKGPLVALPVRADDGALFATVAYGHPFGQRPPPPPRNILLDGARLVVVLLISAVVCYVLARYITAPMLELSSATRRFAEGKLDVRIAKEVAQRADELGGLANDFDHMAERIESLLTQQKQLLGDISHELRSPLARLRLALEIARKKSGKGTEAALDRIETEAALLDDMISQLLTLTRLEGAGNDIPVYEIDVSELLETVAADADFEAHGRNCAVEVMETVSCLTTGNEELLRRAVENVVRNAIRYTAEGTTVEIRMRRVRPIEEPEQAEIEVRDFGPGVPEEDLAHLFQPFYRVSHARERRTGGAGLGLAITERAVAFHHGSVSAVLAEKAGLIVKIRIPLRAFT
jgi:signal transduction histidine kinase